jgi:hypothetical protein
MSRVLDPRREDHMAWSPCVVVDPFPAAAAAARTKQRATKLLCENLTAEQRRQYAAHACFDVIGGSSGRHYRIWGQLPQNVEELDADGRRIRIWCFQPRDPLVLEDVLLAQKVALELFESETLEIANAWPAA